MEALDKDICLLVDEKDNFIGTATKRECHKVGEDGKVPLHRAFSVFLFNKRGDMLLQRRSSQKVSVVKLQYSIITSSTVMLSSSVAPTKKKKKLSYLSSYQALRL